MQTRTEHRALTVGWKLVLLLVHFAAVVIAVFLALYSRFRVDEAFDYFAANRNAFFAFIFFCLPSFYIAGLYEPKNVQNPKNIIRLTLWATFAAAVLSVLTLYGRLMNPLGRGAFVLTVFFTVLFISFFTAIYGKTFPRSRFLLRLVFINEDPLHQELIKLINANPHCGYAIDRVISPFNLRRVYNERIEGLILPTGSIAPEVARALRKSRFNGMEIYDPVFLYGELTGQVPVDFLTETWLFSAALSHSLFHVYKIKRLLDILVSLAGLILFLPIFPLLALAIKLDSRGPVFYGQERVGRNGKLFVITKLRTMVYNAEKANRPVWAEKNDPRVTRLGRMLRRMRLDEFLQLINVLRGEMSLIGPRPERREFVQELSRKIPFYEERILLQPGITGWAQVNYPYAASLEDSKQKLQYDLYYYKNVSLWLDMTIFLRTMRVILSAAGR